MSRRRGIPISAYALIMAVAVLISFGLFTHITSQEIGRVHADLDRTAHATARDELAKGLAQILREGQEAAARFAAWEEVRQQLDVPQYYAYWRSHRLTQGGRLPPNAEDAEIYDVNGRALAQRPQHSLPALIGLPLPPPYVLWRKGQPRLFIFSPSLDAKSETRGYIGLQLDFTSELRQLSFQQLDASSIRFKPVKDGSLSFSDLAARASFGVRANPMGDAVESLLDVSVGHLSLILAIFAILFPALVYLMARPLRAIGQHIDALKGGVAPGSLETLPGPLAIAEVEKVRRSLNDYQAQLDEVHDSLNKSTHELRELAFNDPLTGAGNRRAFEQHLQELPGRMRDGNPGICFVLFDVNHFRAINDSYGHQAGDQILKRVANALRAALSEDDQLFRLGGDEFATVRLVCDRSNALVFAEACQQRIVALDFNDLGIREPVRLSIGVAVGGNDVDEALDLLQWQADVAMYHAKRPGKSNVAVFDELMGDQSRGVYSSWIHNAVYEAVTTGAGLTMFYQPIVDLGNGNITYYEALVRIRHGDEWILPRSIFPLIEARRLETELDLAVLRTVLADLRAGRIPEGTGVSINLSGPTLINERLREWLAEFRVYMDRFTIVLEVTETALITQIGAAGRALSELRVQGFQVALDDFGSGYSSLRYLASMPVDTVKFDANLIANSRAPRQRRIVEHLAQMINEVGHQLVAEGIENAGTLDWIKQAGFALGQGYYFGFAAREPAQLPRTETASGSADGNAESI